MYISIFSPRKRLKKMCILYFAVNMFIRLLNLVNILFIRSAWFRVMNMLVFSKT